MLRFWLTLLVVWGTGWTIGKPAEAAQIKSCLRVVPSGELVIRYGASWCDD